MPRSSRHKSHKQHKHSSRDERNYSDSEEEETVKETKVRDESAKSGSRVSRDSDSSEKRKAKDLLGPGNGDYSAEHGVSKRRKDGAEPAVGSDRWDAREGVRAESFFGDKEIKSDIFLVDSEKTPKSKVSVDSKSRSSRRQESGVDRKEDGLVLPVDAEERKKDNSKVDIDRKAEKDSIRKDSYEHKDVREKERGGDRDRKVQDGRRSDRLVDGAQGGGNETSRKKGAYPGEGSRDSRREVENPESQTPDITCNMHVEKEHEKRVRKKVFSDNKDSRDDEVANADNDRHLSSREDRVKHGKYKDEGHKDDSYKETSREEHENRYKYDKLRDQQSLRERSIDRSEGRQSRDESRPFESNHKKAKLQDSDCEDSTVDDRDTRYRDNRGRKRSPGDGEDYGDIKSRNVKEPCSFIDRKASSGNKLNSPSDRRRSESRNRLLDSVDSSPSSSRQKRSPSSSTHVGKDQSRHGSKQEEPLYTDSLPEERRQWSNSRDVSDQVSEPQSIDKSKREDDKYMRKLSTEDVASLQYSRSPKMEQTSPVALVDKSPSSSSGDRRYSNRASLRRSLDIEEVGQSGGFKGAKDYLTNEDRAQDISMEKASDDRSQDRLHRETTPAGSSLTRTGLIAGNSHSPFPPPQFSGGGDSASVMGSSDDDFRNQTGERKLNNRYKRSGESGNMVTRTQGSNSWKGIPNWPSPGTNGFVPFQHGPGPAGFHQVVPPFPGSLFGVRPSIDLNHAGVAWHDPSRPFGWQNPPDETCPPLLHGWDGSNGVFGDETHIYRRPDWEQSRRLMSNKGWELNSEAWRGQNGNVNVDILTPKKEMDYSSHAMVDKSWGVGQSDQQDGNAMNHLEHSPAESIDVKPALVISTAKRTSEASLSSDFKEKKPEISNQISMDDGARMLGYYLSKVDISMDLVCPELYKQCMNVIKIGGEPTGIKRTIKEVELEDDRAFLKNPYYNLQKLLFPTSAESIFEKSMALYKKQKEEMKVKIRTSSDPDSEPEKLFPTIDVEFVGLSGDPPDAVKQDEHMGLENDVTLVPESEQQELSRTSEEEVPWPTGESIEHAVGAYELPTGEGNADFQDDPSAVVKESECEISSSGIVGPESCVAVMPELIECRVNLSRIHHSPENTH